MKVAQYQVLGWRSEKSANRSGWDDRRLLTLLKPNARDQKSNASIVRGPGSWRDGHLFFASFPSTSYWATLIGSLRDVVCHGHPAVGDDNQPGLHK
jgi:hypothetical protein